MGNSIKGFKHNGGSPANKPHLEYTMDELEKRIGYHFVNQDLLRQALTHSSFSNEQKPGVHIKDYERIEFLGDAVLEVVVSDYL